MDGAQQATPSLSLLYVIFGRFGALDMLLKKLAEKNCEEKALAPH